MFKSTLQLVPLSPLNCIAIYNNSKGGISMTVSQNKKHRDSVNYLIGGKTEGGICFSFMVSGLIRPYSNVYC